LSSSHLKPYNEQSKKRTTNRPTVFFVIPTYISEGSQLIIFASKRKHGDYDLKLKNRLEVKYQESYLLTYAAAQVSL